MIKIDIPTIGPVMVMLELDTRILDGIKKQIVDNNIVLMYVFLVNVLKNASGDLPDLNETL